MPPAHEDLLAGLFTDRDSLHHPNLNKPPQDSLASKETHFSLFARAHGFRNQAESYHVVEESLERMVGIIRRYKERRQWILLKTWCVYLRARVCVRGCLCAGAGPLQAVRMQAQACVCMCVRMCVYVCACVCLRSLPCGCALQKGA